MSRHRPKKRIPRWAHRPAYWGVRTAAALINVAGAEPSMRFMRRLGAMAGRLPMERRRLHRAAENIAWCFPSWNRAMVRDYALESYRHLFCLGAEFAMSPRLISEDGYGVNIELGDMSKALGPMCRERPCIFITGHCGNWELLGYTLATLGITMHALYRPLDLAPLDAWVRETRRRPGLMLVDKFGAAEALPRLLEQHQPIAFIADQNAGDRGLFVPFFNRLASTYKTIGLLAMRYGATVVCGMARRLSGLSARTNGTAVAETGPFEGEIAPNARESQFFRYRLELVDVFGPDEWKHQPDPLFYITARYRRAIEAMVHRAPEQYLWMHRYWKSRPAHERRGHQFPAQLREKIASLPWIDDDDVTQIVDRSAQDAAAIAAGSR